MSTKHDFVSDLADLIRPLTNFEGVETWSATAIRIDEPNSSSLWRFDADEGFVYCGEPCGDIDGRQTDDWFDEQHAIGAALHAADRGTEWCLNSAQEGGWEAARDAE